MIQLQLKPELEEELKTVASRHGQTPEEYAASALEKQIAAETVEAPHPDYTQLPPDQWIEKFNEWLASRPRRDGPPLSDWAVSRDSMYD